MTHLGCKENTKRVVNPSHSVRQNMSIITCTLYFTSPATKQSTFFKNNCKVFDLQFSFSDSDTLTSKTGCEIDFFSDSLLVPKFFKVVANSKIVGHHF